MSDRDIYLTAEEAEAVLAGLAVGTAAISVMDRMRGDTDISPFNLPRIKVIANKVSAQAIAHAGGEQQTEASK